MAQIERDLGPIRIKPNDPVTDVHEVSSLETYERGLCTGITLTNHTRHATISVGRSRLMTRINPIDRIVSALAMGLMHLLWLGLGRPLDRTSFGRPLFQIEREQFIRSSERMHYHSHSGTMDYQFAPSLS
jgi:hypothetical protein